MPMQFLNQDKSLNWNNQIHLRAMAKHLNVNAGGRNEDIRQRIHHASLKAIQKMKRNMHNSTNHSPKNEMREMQEMQEMQEMRW